MSGEHRDRVPEHAARLLDVVRDAARQEQFLDVVSAEEARARFERHLDLTPLTAETVPLAAALGRVIAADVLAATASVAVGLEILDSRYRDYRFTMADVVADNTSAGRYLVGAPVPVAGIDLRLVGVVLEHNGEVVATASGSASLGHPAAAVAWLVRALAAEGEGLLAGEVVLSGGLTAAVPVGPGDVVVAAIDRLGTIELSCA